MKSLAEHLGAVDPRPEHKRPQDDFDALIDVTEPVKFCKGIVESREFRQYILSGIVLGDLPPAIMTRIIDHAWGKPVEQLHVTSTVAVEELTPSQLEERAARLSEMARFLRRAEQFDEPLDAGSVH
jgi:hypothetical protein